jgi:hypothetical protein
MFSRGGIETIILLAKGRNKILGGEHKEDNSEHGKRMEDENSSHLAASGI